MTPVSGLHLEAKEDLNIKNMDRIWKYLMDNNYKFDISKTDKNGDNIEFYTSEKVGI